jgi:hypothetical protein
MVAGQWQLRHGQHAQGVAIARAFEAEMAALWGEA